MHTETVLIANPNTHHLDMVNRIQRRIEGYLLAKESNMLSYNMPRAQLDTALTITHRLLFFFLFFFVTYVIDLTVTHSHGTATISPLDNPDWVSVTSLIKADETSNIMDAISAIGAKSIVVYNPTNCRT
jgi:ATP phosphoribosyltransferase